MIKSFRCDNDQNAFLIDYFLLKKVSGIIGFSCNIYSKFFPSQVSLKITNPTLSRWSRRSVAKTIQLGEYSKCFQQYKEN